MPGSKICLHAIHRHVTISLQGRENKEKKSLANLLNYMKCNSFCLSNAFIRVLAEKLNLNYEEAERWIVNLIRTSKLDAKIDSKTGTVAMEPNHPNV